MGKNNENILYQTLKELNSFLYKQSLSKLPVDLILHNGMAQKQGCRDAGEGLWKGDVELGRTSAKSLVWDTLQEGKKAQRKPE